MILKPTPDPSMPYQPGDVAPSGMPSSPPSQATGSYTPQQATSSGLNWVGKNDQMFGQKGYVGYQEPVSTPVPTPQPAPVASEGTLERRALLAQMR